MRKNNKHFVGVIDPESFRYEKNNSLHQEACVAKCIAIAIELILHELKGMRPETFLKRKKITNSVVSNIHKFYWQCMQRIPPYTSILMEEGNFKKIDEWLKKSHNTRLIVYSMDRCDVSKLTLLYRGKIEQAECLAVYLLIYNKHCYLITNVKLFFSPHKYCEKCSNAHQYEKECPYKACHLCNNEFCRPDLSRKKHCNR